MASAVLRPCGRTRLPALEWAVSEAWLVWWSGRIPQRVMPRQPQGKLALDFEARFWRDKPLDHRV